jgi:hypothetical protein
VTPPVAGAPWTLAAAALALTAITSNVVLAGRSTPVEVRPVGAGELETSRSWSGYVLTARPRETISFTRITGTWTVPTVTCAPGDAGAASAVWVGLGGYRDPPANLEQIGIDANCDVSGRPTYYAWFELVPYPAYPIEAKVGPGDVVSAEVRIVSPNVELRLENRTRSWTVVKRISWAEPDTSSAEWIVEAPATCIRFRYARPSLASFRSVKIRELAAVANRRAGTLSSPAWTATALRLVPAPQTGTLGYDDETVTGPESRPDPTAVSPAGAAPGPLSADGSAFTIAWRVSQNA